MAGAALGVPVLANVLVAALDPGAAGEIATGAADAAFVAMAGASTLLFLRWRLVGEAACASYAIAAAVAGLLVMSVATRLSGPPARYVTALRASAALVVMVLMIDALLTPQVRAGLRPVVESAVALTGALALAAPLAFTPAWAVLRARQDGFGIVALVESAACAAVGVAAIAVALRHRRALHTGPGAAMLAVAGAVAALARDAAGPPGDWTELPTLFLLVGAVELLATAAADTRAAIAVVVEDVRGRRRWETAERMLTDVRDRYRGQRHDIRGVLSAVDGALLAVGGGGRATDPEALLLIGAMRAEIRRLQAMLSEGPAASCPSRSYDLSELLREIVWVRSAAPQRLRWQVPPVIMAEGCPVRVAVVVSNLLANAAAHAGGAAVSLSAALVAGPRGAMAQVVVADDGPGMAEEELERAFERGWRGHGADGPPGEGLGLYHCRELAEAEGGQVWLRPTHPGAAPGRRGLTAVVQLPAGSAIVQMPRPALPA